MGFRREKGPFLGGPGEGPGEGSGRVQKRPKRAKNGVFDEKKVNSCGL